MSKQDFTILVATMTGTADMVADEVADALKEEGYSVDVRPMDDLDAGFLADIDNLIVCSSTYGHGDVPDNGQALFADLETTRPDLSCMRYAVFGLGDKTYHQTFCNGGRQFDTLIGDLGARRFCEFFAHDASEGTLPEDEAADWVRQWVKDLHSDAA